MTRNKDANSHARVAIYIYPLCMGCQLYLQTSSYITLSKWSLETICHNILKQDVVIDGEIFWKVWPCSSLDVHRSSFQCTTPLEKKKRSCWRAVIAAYQQKNFTVVIIVTGQKNKYGRSRSIRDRVSSTCLFVRWYAGEPIWPVRLAENVYILFMKACLSAITSSSDEAMILVSNDYPAFPPSRTSSNERDHNRSSNRSQQVRQNSVASGITDIFRKLLCYSRGEQTTAPGLQAMQTSHLSSLFILLINILKQRNGSLLWITFDTSKMK